MHFHEKNKTNSNTSWLLNFSLSGALILTFKMLITSAADDMICFILRENKTTFHMNQLPGR